MLQFLKLLSYQEVFMFWSILTVGCYTISSLGDKFISAKLKYKANEFAFFVALATSVWLGIMLMFSRIPNAAVGFICT